LVQYRSLHALHADAIKTDSGDNVKLQIKAQWHGKI